MLLLILLSALPDAMVVPVLRDLMVERYGATAEQAQAFLAVNLLGAGLAVPLVRRLRRRFPAWSIAAVGAMADGWLLALMWLPVGFPATLALRGAEGVADVMTFAALFQMLGPAASGPLCASPPVVLLWLPRFGSSSAPRPGSLQLAQPP